MIKKYLVTGGCSFSECHTHDRHGNAENKTWPIALRERMPEYEHWCEAMGAQGNHLIGHRVQHRVSQLLKSADAKDILVGVMWSGSDRWAFYHDKKHTFSKNLDGWQLNPVVVTDLDPGGWIMCNHHWTHEFNEPYYKYYANRVYSQIQTLEAIVNLQRFLRERNVQYFMTTNFTSTFDQSLRNHPSCEWIWDQIDFSVFLPVTNEHDWVKEHCPIPGAKNFHPRNEQHQAFVDQVIWPWIQQNNLIY
jgi:hypothetical protein